MPHCYPNNSVYYFLHAEITSEVAYLCEIEAKAATLHMTNTFTIVSS